MQLDPLDRKSAANEFSIHLLFKDPLFSQSNPNNRYSLFYMSEFFLTGHNDKTHFVSYLNSETSYNPHIMTLTCQESQDS